MTDFNINTRIGMLRQWLNEDRITDTKKMVTNEMIMVWLAPAIDKLERDAEAGARLAMYMTDALELEERGLKKNLKAAVRAYCTATQDSPKE